MKLSNMAGTNCMAHMEGRKMRSSKAFSIYKFMPLVALLALAAVVPSQTFGSVSVDIDYGVGLFSGEGVAAKSNEYGTKNLLFGDLNANYYTEGQYLLFRAHDVATESQEYKIVGGVRESYRYNLGFDETTHHYSVGNMTVYSNPGSAALTPIATPYDTTTWTAFEYKKNINNINGGFELTFGTPYFFNVNASHVGFGGMLPQGAAAPNVDANNVATTDSYLEFPMPLDATMNDVTAEAGYRGEHFVLSLKAALSNYAPTNQTMTFVAPAWNPADAAATHPIAATDTTFALAPSNSVTYGASLSVLDLPMNSVFGLALERQSFTNDVTIANQAIIVTSAPGATTKTYALKTFSSAANEFLGSEGYMTIKANLTSRPLSDLSTKLYYDYTNRSVDSNTVTFTYGTLSVSNTVDPVLGTNRMFDYQQHRGGLDVGYKLNPQNRFNGGYEMKSIHRDGRPEAPNTSDSTVSLGYKNTSFDLAAFKLKYVYLNRNTDYGWSTLGNGSNDVATAYRWFRRYDVASKVDHKLKFGVDLAPIEALDIGANYQVAYAKYSDANWMGVQSALSNSLQTDATFRLTDLIRISGLFEIEKTDRFAAHRTWNTTTGGANPANPTTPVTGGGYNWTGDLNDQITSYGVNASFPIIEDKIQMTVGWRREKGDGQFAIGMQPGALDAATALGIAANPNVATTFSTVDNYGDFTKDTVGAEIAYKYSKALKLALIYSYEHMTWSDLFTDSYQLAPVTGSSPKYSTPYFTGAFADQNYVVNELMVKATYQF